MELQVPANISNSIAFSIGQRVSVQGTRLNSGSFGQSVVYVQSINQQQNIFLLPGVDVIFISAFRGRHSFGRRCSLFSTSQAYPLVYVENTAVSNAHSAAAGAYFRPIA